jgi:hypothetical protein
MGTVLALWRRRKGATAAAAQPPAGYDNLRREVALAAEHVASIRMLLEIAREHQQPIPPAALTNLDLVAKNLAETLRRMNGGEPVAAATPPGLLRPLSAGRASPSGK